MRWQTSLPVAIGFVLALCAVDQHGSGDVLVVAR